MNMNISVKDFPKICRLCLSLENLQSIYSANILNFLNKITDIEVGNVIYLEFR